MPGGTLRKRLQTVWLLILLLALTQLAIVTPIHTQTQVAQVIPSTHIIGGFSATTTAQIANAAQDGVQTIFYYGNPPAQNSVLGQSLQSLHMKIVDGFISSNLHYYECQKARTLKPPPYGLNSYCGQASYPTFAGDNAFLARIAAHLKQSQSNPLILGYWVLDDWAWWDAGGARQLLIQIHALIQQYTPARPAICGFGASLTTNHTFGWNDWLANNFSSYCGDEK